MYTFIMYDGDKVLDTQEFNEKPVIRGNQIESGVFSAKVKKDFIIIEGRFDGVLDTSKDISHLCKPAEEQEKERVNRRIDEAETTIFNVLMEVSMMKGSGKDGLL
ncbi:hypothetical protein [Salimicrobium album]|uniref:Uncharacterized protein n=1 Tax=Salimicrobium album TaxID=50717 RepID=A0A1H3DIF4_9BACI|nr:hypothetical protein [Salimicrobium album]SDX65444.1 hypothetical protein SAMN04488081_0956 [Salimicrobium album]